MHPKVFIELLKETFKEWQEDKAARLAAALAYYTAFSIAPLLIIAIAITALFFGEQAAQGQIVGQLQSLVGREVAESTQSLIASSRKPEAGSFATIISFVVLFFGASGVFTELQDALNTIWEVAPKPNQGVKAVVKTRALALGVVLGIGFLLLVSLVLSTALALLGNYLGGMMPGLQFLWSILNFALSFGVITLLFALMFEFLPDVKITWNDVWIGAAITALLFTIGKSLLSLYLGNSGVGSTYGAAGSLIVLLLWVNYSAQILFFGAEFTQVYANKYGSLIVPASNAIPITEDARAQQGIPHREHLEATAQERQIASPNESTPRQPRQPAAVLLASLIELSRSLRGNKRNRR